MPNAELQVLYLKEFVYPHPEFSKKRSHVFKKLALLAGQYKQAEGYHTQAGKESSYGAAPFATVSQGFSVAF